MHTDYQNVVTDDGPIDARRYASAILNILADAAEEKANLENAQRAFLNILKDSADEKVGVANTQRAVLNILDDFASEQKRLEATQKASLNILEDSAADRTRLQGAQRAMVNILEDAAGERARLETTQKAILNIMEDSTTERTDLHQAQTAVVNILADLADEADERRRFEQSLQEANQIQARHLVEIQAVNKELEQFAYVASHDLQEPLRMVASYTQLLGERYQGRLDDKADKYIRYAVDGATRMQGLINDLLTLSRVGTSGKPFEETDCATLVAAVLQNLDKAVEESGAEIVVADSLPTVMGDRTQLGQLFQNLIENAIKFRGDKKPRIVVSASRGTAEWVFEVRDNGIGIAAEFHDRIFVIFQRLHQREQYKGTGIGLALVKKIVERHGGRVWLESAVGAGTRFLFTISDKSA